MKDVASKRFSSVFAVRPPFLSLLDISDYFSNTLYFYIHGIIYKYFAYFQYRREGGGRGKTPGPRPQGGP